MKPKSRADYFTAWLGPPLAYFGDELKKIKFYTIPKSRKSRETLRELHQRIRAPLVYEKSCTEKLCNILGWVYSDENLKHKFNEADHPRDADGKFAEKDNSRNPNHVAEQIQKTLLQKLRKIIPAGNEKQTAQEKRDIAQKFYAATRISSVNTFNEQGKDGKPSKTPELQAKMSDLKVQFFDFSTLSDTIQAETADTLESVCKDLPVVRGSIKSITVIQSLDDYARVSDNRDMELSGKWYNDPEKLAASYAEDVKNGFHPAGTDYRALITHEAVHAGLLKYAEAMGIMPEVLAARIKSAVMKELGITEKDITKELSKYADGDLLDFISEGAAEYKHSQNPRRLAKAIYKRIAKLLGGKV